MKFFVLLTTLLASLAVFAGPVHVGNGGNAIKIADTYYLLDLAEQGIAEEPVFKAVANKFFYNYFQARTLNSASRMSQATLDLFSKKLAEIAELDPVYAEALITAFENVRWMFVNYRLSDIPVESIIAGPYYQVAARTNDVILIDLMYWYQMNEENRVALLLHELNYILIIPKKEIGSPKFEKSAIKSRLHTGYLFTQNIQTISPMDFSKRIQIWFPSRLANKFDQLVFYPFTYKTNNEPDKMAFDPYIQINGNIPGPRLANMGFEHFKYSLCIDAAFDLRTVELMAIMVEQDVFDGDNNSQDVTTFVDNRIPNFRFIRLPGEKCNDAAERLYNEISAFIPGVFYNE